MNPPGNNAGNAGHDIFLSFRREDGQEYALKLRSALEDMGYAVFLDDEDLENGPFYGGVLSAIENTPVFLSILTPGYLGHVRGGEDWMLKELKCALDSSRAIFFINPDSLFHGFPDGIPEEFRELASKPVLDIQFGRTFRQGVNQLEAQIRSHVFKRTPRQTPVFISYARVDKPIVSPLVERLEKDLRINCWNDLEDIESGEQFEEVIIQAIDSSRIVLFMLSDNGLLSKWTKREVYYAEGEGKEIIPVVIDGKGLRGWFKFHFGNVHYIDISSPDGYPKLVSDLHSRLGTTPSYRGAADGHEWVDMGSGVKWATTNLEAPQPEDLGMFCAWGETAPKSDYSWGTYRHGDARDRLTKYVPDGCGRYGLDGFSDGRTAISPEDDIASVLWGESWRIPTKEDFKILLETCDGVWTKRNGRSGYLLTSRLNGEQLFLPAAGSISETLYEDRGSIGRYWSGSVDTDDPCFAWSLFFNADKIYSIYAARSGGLAIRPVTD